MTKKELMIKAHQMTKEIKNEYPEVDYKFQLGLCLAYLQTEGEVKMVELKGSEKQVKWAEDIRNQYLKNVDGIIEGVENKLRSYVRPVVEEFKEEIYSKMKEETKAERRRVILEILKEIKEKIENEESAKKFIDVYTSFKYVPAYEITAISVLAEFR